MCDIICIIIVCDILVTIIIDRGIVMCTNIMVTMCMIKLSNHNYI